MAAKKLYLNKYAAEFIGTFALIFFGCGAIMVDERLPGNLAGSTIPVVFGLVVASMIYAVGHISGAHFNPAVTLAFAAARHFPRRDLLGYWVAQFAGALAAISLLAFILPPGNNFGMTLPEVPAAMAIMWEFILTFFLMFVIMSVATDTRAVGTMAGAAIGATVMLAAFVGGPVTGASMNPARTIAPALYQGSLDVSWIYFLGPCAGSVAAALVYNLIRCHNPSVCTEELRQEIPVHLDVDSVREAKGCC